MNDVEITSVAAPAKLTVSLAITSVRDDGMHEIDAEMVSLDFGDRLDISPGTGLTVVGADQTHTIGNDIDNLVTRALKLAGRDASVVLHKTIPPGAGLGGGSSDAAAILRWAGFTDLDAAAALGADIAYCMVGGRARVRGIGEIVEPLTFESRTFTLVTPPLFCSTPVVYRQWDAMGGPSGDHGNDLEPAAIAAVPEMAEWRDRLGDATGCQPRLAGSGSTWFVEGDFPQAGRVARTIPAL